MKSQVQHVIDKSEKHAAKHIDDLKLSAKSKMKADLQAELVRLKELQKTNPSIREDEITTMEQRIKHCDYYIDKASLQMQGLKLVVAS